MDRGCVTNVTVMLCLCCSSLDALAVLVEFNCVIVYRSPTASLRTGFPTADRLPQCWKQLITDHHRRQSLIINYQILQFGKSHFTNYITIWFVFFAVGMWPCVGYVTTYNSRLVCQLVAKRENYTSPVRRPCLCFRSMRMWNAFSFCIKRVFMITTDTFWHPKAWQPDDCRSFCGEKKMARFCLGMCRMEWSLVRFTVLLSKQTSYEPIGWYKPKEL